MRIPSLVALLVAVAAAPAQQVGDSDRNYAVNGNGLNQASYVQTTLSVPGQSLDSVYAPARP